MSSSSSVRSRRVIGLLESQLDRGFHRAALQSVSAAALGVGADLICFDGGVVARDPGAGSTPNILYDLVSPANVDGLIIWASALDWELTGEQMETFCRGFAPLPVVTVGRVFGGIPGVLVDNYQGMREAARHLIADHGFDRIAFLRGPSGAEEEELRFRGYCDALREAGLAFDPQLVSSRTQWQRPDGPVVIAELLDERGLRPGVDFQAILAVGDDMACGAIEALRGRGVRVPDDVAVIGFNDDEEGRAILPALTTVAQPVVQMGRAAVAMLTELLEERAAPAAVTLPVDLAVRRSCGCLSSGVLRAAAMPQAGEPDDVAGKMARLSGLPVAAMRQLADAFRAEIDSSASERFLAAFGALLQAAALDPRAGGQVARWRIALSTMRSAMLPALTEPARSRAENLWQQAQVLIGETAAQARAYEHFRADQDTRRLSEFSRRIQTASDRRALFEALAAELPAFGVASCFLTLYEDPEHPLAGARLALAFDRGQRIELPRDGTRFPTANLLPDLPGFTWPQDLLVLPLYFAARQLGCLLISADERGLALSETFRGQVSAALEGLFLREEIRAAWRKAEESNLLKSRFLSTVSHELRTPLSLIVGTIEMMQRDAANEALLADASGEGFRRDLESIRTGAHHLSHLIGDVLDLASSQAGELRLTCEPLPLDDALRRVAVLGETMARERGLAWRVDLGESPLPLVWGDRTRLQQVALNLISNAVKFTAKGTVSLWVEVGAHEVMVAVSDTGMGIPLAEQELIFDEFRQSDRAARRGFGGMGLGLAISKRLVELHGGRMGVLSTGAEGSGSTFYFTLPILAEVAAGAEKLPQQGDTVLLLTERQPVPGAPAAALRDHLLGRGFKVAVLPVSGRSDWLAQIVAAPPGAIALDYEPAAEQAWDLMRVLKLDPATSDIPVLFYSLREDAQGSVLAMDYLAKPLGGEALAGALARQGIGASGEQALAILVVDDDPTMRDLHVRMVRAVLPRARVLTAHDGRDALRIMANTRPHLVLLDLMMPELDGFGVLEAMRDDPQLRGVPVIVLTAQILGRREMERLQKGVSAVLGKGLFAQDEVLAQVEAALARGGKRLGSEAQRVARMAMAYIHERYTEPVSREQMARDLNVNERYLTRCFGQETGLTPIAYLNRYRVAQARNLLDRSQLSVTEVALACGFSDSSYFGRVFQKEIGLSPTEYRRNKNL